MPSTDEWTAAIWLTTPSDRLGGTAIDLLRQAKSVSPHNEELAAVLAIAREDAARWAQ